MYLGTCRHLRRSERRHASCKKIGSPNRLYREFYKAQHHWTRLKLALCRLERKRRMYQRKSGYLNRVVWENGSLPVVFYRGSVTIAEYYWKQNGKKIAVNLKYKDLSWCITKEIFQDCKPSSGTNSQYGLAMVDVLWRYGIILRKYQSQTVCSTENTEKKIRTLNITKRKYNC